MAYLMETRMIAETNSYGLWQQRCPDAFEEYVDNFAGSSQCCGSGNWEFAVFATIEQQGVMYMQC
jgi:hypothetical protein